jgi:hypothetical protein
VGFSGELGRGSSERFPRRGGLPREAEASAGCARERRCSEQDGDASGELGWPERPTPARSYTGGGGGKPLGLCCSCGGAKGGMGSEQRRRMQRGGSRQARGHWTARCCRRRRMSSMRRRAPATVGRWRAGAVAVERERPSWAGPASWTGQEVGRVTQKVKVDFPFYISNPKLTKQPQIQNLNK